MAKQKTARVCIEAGARRTFASALDWPGWSRSGRDEAQALGTLASYAGRYALVAAEAGLDFDSGASFEVVERVTGNATTDFGAPAMVASAESDPPDAIEAARLCALVAACWAVLDKVVAGAPAQLRKGPRGGGRDTEEVKQHVIAAELAYARKVGIRLGGDVAATRAAVLDVIAGRWGASEASFEGSRQAGSSHPSKWPPRYAARRIAWHVTDHAWEIEDKS